MGVWVLDGTRYLQDTLQNNLEGSLFKYNIQKPIAVSQWLIKVNAGSRGHETIYHLVIANLERFRMSFSNHITVHLASLVVV